MLELKNITKTFGKTKALDALTMTVPRGAVYGLVGPNGAGKTTAIRHAVGVYRPDSGTVLLDGQPVFENPAVKEKLVCIPDEIFFFHSATLEDMHKFYKGIYAQFDSVLFSRLYEVFRLPPNIPIRRFSKGMQKQAAFQLSLCVRPELLVLDEPVDGLDPVMRRQVWSMILSDVAQRGTTVLISSHNLRELEDICDHVGIMQRGKMLLERSLADMQGITHKVQLVGEVPPQLTVIHASASGRMQTLVVRGSVTDIEAQLKAVNPVYYDILPLSLEEIFIYELGGVNNGITQMVL